MHSKSRYQPKRPKYDPSTISAKQQWIYFKEEQWLRNGKCKVYELIQDTNNQNITITIPSNKDTNLKDPHDANQLLKPSKYSKRLVAIFKRVEDIRITSISLLCLFAGEAQKRSQWKGHCRGLCRLRDF